ncbi:hypothetical protein LMG31886_21570 [Xanthomonas hydrangeae]|nr:hypothetical protein LMG31884_22130 [Xanthomonas hydrangeae]CAD7716539.1 hypothetical protein LMG31884_22130 [Xanthomonas hydrangeae]CAD7731957.1 hypothetical protein LMG31887_22120 [Xanthomonas hydrangeae]CAD7731960.1 hypothetical protein LMG31887_22120 [Xanthomonas hydrangeae]CAD7734878.1 hypothetical protein LMG31886_21570 [Xanthomonas hydrangeae]
MVASRDMRPRKMSSSEFYRSNVFIARSPRLGRRVELVSSQYEAWLFIEFDPQIEWFCERPPMEIDLLPLERKVQPLDFWVVTRTGEQYGVLIYHEKSMSARGRSLDLIGRSIDRANIRCQLWRADDMQKRLVHLRNLKQLLPLVLMPAAHSEGMAERLLSYLKWAAAACSPATWSDVIAHLGSEIVGEANCLIARLIHSGQIKANLFEHPLSGATKLSLV